jgi:hypothetical protein
MANLAIRGHETRGKEVIEILKMLGGKDDNYYCGEFIDKIYFINDDGYIKSCYRMQHLEYFQLSLEEFLEKFPYKVGDKVQVFKSGEVFTISSMFWDKKDCTVYYFNPDIIQYYSIEELNKYNKPYKEETTEEKGTLVEIDLTRELCIADEVEVILGDYEFVLKDGKTYFVKKNKYPKTYKECCEVLDYNPNEDENCIEYLIKPFTELLLCRNAYWIIAGKQMRLEGYWEPDWYNNKILKYCIVINNGFIVKQNFCNTQFTLAFPTEEMRDVFYENFQNLIEKCKSLI